MEHEVRALAPMIYYHVWDNFPPPTFNKNFYDSNDFIADISKVTNKLVGMEVLIRWNHPEFGIVSPFYFIPLAIEIGFIVEIDLWVMDTAMKQIKKWIDKGYNIGVVSCNLTVFQLEKGDFIVKLKEMFEKNQISPKYFGLEITEEGIMKDPENNIKLLKEIKNLNITLSIDDFGTGYSSFAYLRKLPIDKLKIDRTFIKDIPQNEDDKVITSSIIALAKQLKLKTIAEGVETEEQKDFVFSHGCDAIQGYYYSPPIPADEIEEKFLRLNS
jgi:EAL domain-containing protein (putative c-di-GMP-specific phosphodiesterase class I)